MKMAMNPKHPERICWGCSKLCPANDLVCGNGTVRTQHPCEIFGEDWAKWLGEKEAAAAPAHTDAEGFLKVEALG
ncbi:MAG TPA: DUF3079 domain-containing protein [Candidatus Koribacter sp.]|jgi:hypothetical protein